MFQILSRQYLHISISPKSRKKIISPGLGLPQSLLISVPGTLVSRVILWKDLKWLIQQENMSKDWEVIRKRRNWITLLFFFKGAEVCHHFECLQNEPQAHLDQCQEKSYEMPSPTVALVKPGKHGEYNRSPRLQNLISNSYFNISKFLFVIPRVRSQCTTLAPWIHEYIQKT